MYQAADVLFIYTETPLHAGAGAGTGAIDLPIQRERLTGYPLVQASGLKGALRDAARIKAQANTAQTEKQSNDMRIIFGAETQQENEHAAAISVSDARLLLFPVRSLTGVFAWTTSLGILHRFQRDLQMAGQTIPDLPTALPEPDNDNQALVTATCALKPSNEDKIVLEEFAFDAASCELTTKLAQWLADKALPHTPEYQYWRNKLKTSLVILPDDALRDFTQFSTEVITRTRLEAETKTVADGQLWIEEYLPTDALLYAPIFASKPRQKQADLPNDWQGKDEHDVLKQAKALLEPRLQVGGNETIGRGMIYSRWLGGTS